MRRIITGIAAAAFMAVVPTLALGGNTEMAEQIAQTLRSSGQMNDYKVGIRYQDGTVWLRGRVTSEQQMNAAIRLVFQAPGVNRVVNQLSVGENEKVEPVGTPAQQSALMPTGAGNPLRHKNATGEENIDQPQNIGLAKRLETAISGSTRYEAGVRRVSAEESAEPTVQPMVSQQMMYAQQPLPIAAAQRAQPMSRDYVAMQPRARGPMAANGAPMPMYQSAAANGVAAARYDQPCMPNYAWPSYASYPNYASVTYPKQYSPTAWPYIGPFYPYPQVPMGWRKVTMEWDDGWWFLDFKDQPASCWRR